MTKIFSPNKNYSGVVAGIQFRKGEAETDSMENLWWFYEKGYIIKEVAKPLHKNLTVRELKEIAKESGIEGYSSMKKAELIEAIEGD